MKPSLMIYIDEAGDPGVRDGLRYIGERHEWLCLAAAVVPSGSDELIVEWVKEMRLAAHSRQSGSLHYHRITTARRPAVCAVLAEKPIRGFVLVSHKSNLREYVNPRIQQMIAAGTFYNWCLRLLLERVTAWCERWQRQRFDGQVGPIEVMFARSGAHDYEHFFSYIDRLRMQAETGTLFLKGPGLNPKMLDRAAWSVRPAEAWAGLQIADTLASSFYQAANTVAPTWDLAPAKALAPIIAGAPAGRAANRGVTVWPLPDQAAVPEDARAIFRAYGYKF